MRFYCPGCWCDFERDFDTCPRCGLDIQSFYAAKDYVDKLILSLEHPEPSTPIRAAWILGQRRESRAVKALMGIVMQRKDIFLVRAAVAALCSIGTPEALGFAATLSDDPDKGVRQLAADIKARGTAINELKQSIKSR